MSMNSGSLSQLKARTGSIGREMARLKAGGGNGTTNQSFRLARVGPGWVLGSIEAVSGVQHPGSLIAGMQQVSITYAAVHNNTDPYFSFTTHSDPLLSSLHFLQENRGDRRRQP
jgi:hypothetical protein